MNNVLNNVTLCGRLTADPEYNVYNGQKGDVKVAKYSLAIDKKMGEGTDFFPVQCFGSTAVWVHKNLKKGTKVIVEGYLEQDSYKDKEGKKVSRTVITITNHIFAEAKKKDGESASSNEEETMPAEKSAASSDPDMVGVGFLPPEDDEPSNHGFKELDDSMSSPWG